MAPARQDKLFGGTCFISICTSGRGHSCSPQLHAERKRGLGRCPPLQHRARRRTQQGPPGCSSPLQSEEGFIKGKRLIIYLAPLHLHTCSSPPSCRLLRHPFLTSCQKWPNGSKRKWSTDEHLTKRGWCTEQLLSCINAREPLHPSRALQLPWHCCNTAK